MIKQNIKVLLIEDNLDYAQLIKRILSKKTSSPMEVEHHDSFSGGYERASRGGLRRSNIRPRKVFCGITP
jgi:hypothetical protein